MNDETDKSAAGGPLAVIEIGAHTARVQISQVSPQGEWETLDQVMQPVPLWRDIYRDGQISAANMRLAAEVARDYVRLLRDYGVTAAKAVVSGAVREAVNRDIFLERLHDLGGMPFGVLEEAEEIRLLFLATQEVMRGRYGLAKWNAVMCMLGPDVSQVLFLEKGHLRSNETVRLGTLRLREELGGTVSALRLRELIDPFVAAVVNSVARLSPTQKPEMFIAVGSTARALVEMGSRSPSQPVMVMSRARFEQRFAQISGMSASQIAVRYQLPDVVAQGMEPCCNMLAHFFEITAADQLIIPMVSTRDALLHDLWRERSGGEDRFLPEIISAACHLGDKFGYDAAHARTVADVAVNLFDALSELHHMTPRDRLLLRLAGLLHDIGFYISSRQHHKHSYYLLRNSELPGISPAEQEIVALVARYHRRAAPRSSHPEFMVQPPDVRVRVTKLAALLRLADALDRSHRQQVRDVRVAFRENRLVVAAPGSGDLTLERLGLDRKADLFKEVYGLKVVLENA